MNELGSGGFADAYLSSSSPPARRVAIKVLRPDVLAASALEGFPAEVNAMALLEHPRIGAIF